MVDGASSPPSPFTELDGALDGDLGGQEEVGVAGVGGLRCEESTMESSESELELWVEVRWLELMVRWLGR